MEWYLSDHLGSTSLMIDGDGLEVERTEYYPYGQVQSGGLEKYGFTGQKNGADTELMYYGARYYSPEYRIFVQPDTMLPDVYNPQALNRYAYALNNPLKYTDPSGHFWALALRVVATGGTALFINDFNEWNHYRMSTDEFMVSCSLELAGGGKGSVVGKFGGKTIKYSDEIVEYSDDAVEVGAKSPSTLKDLYGTYTEEGLGGLIEEIKRMGTDDFNHNAEAAGKLFVESSNEGAVLLYENAKQQSDVSQVQVLSPHGFETRIEEYAYVAVESTYTTFSSFNYNLFVRPAAYFGYGVDTSENRQEEPL